MLAFHVVAHVLYLSCSIVQEREEELRVMSEYAWWGKTPLATGTATHGQELRIA